MTPHSCIPVSLWSRCKVALRVALLCLATSCAMSIDSYLLNSGTTSDRERDLVHSTLPRARAGEVW